jgi:hypothetical protein
MPSGTAGALGECTDGAEVHTFMRCQMLLPKLATLDKLKYHLAWSVR